MFDTDSEKSKSEKKIIEDLNELEDYIKNENFEKNTNEESIKDSALKILRAFLFYRPDLSYVKVSFYEI